MSTWGSALNFYIASRLSIPVHLLLYRLINELVATLSSGAGFVNVTLSLLLLCFISAVCHYERHRNLELKIYRSDKDVRQDAHKNLLQSLRLKKICLSWEEIYKCSTLVNNEEVPV